MSQGGLVFYDPATGTGQFYLVTDGKIGTAVWTFTDWRSSWTQIVPGNFGGGGLIDLLFYEGSTGATEFWSIGSDGKFQLFKSVSLSANLTQIIPGKFSDSDGTDLLLYDANQGLGQFYRIVKGSFVSIHNETGWRNSWKQIVTFPGSLQGATYYTS